jgi:hypothetical protein
MKKNIFFLFLLFLFVVVVIRLNVTEEKETEEKTEIQKIINIKDIAGKQLSDVAKVLGTAEKTEKVQPSRTPCKQIPCDKVFFQNGKFEVVFINNLADWITINNTSDNELDENAIELLGLTKTAPTFQNIMHVIRWENIEGFKEISFFNDGSGKIKYIYIKVNTE